MLLQVLIQQTNVDPNTDDEDQDQPNKAETGNIDILSIIPEEGREGVKTAVCWLGLWVNKGVTCSVVVREVENIWNGAISAPSSASKGQLQCC